MPTTELKLLPELTREWNKLVEAKWKELRQKQGHFISAYSPQLTHREDMNRRLETRREVMKWTKEWFLSHGRRVTCTPDSTNTDGFSIKEEPPEIKPPIVQCPACGEKVTPQRGVVTVRQTPHTMVESWNCPTRRCGEKDIWRPKVSKTNPQK